MLKVPVNCFIFVNFRRIFGAYYELLLLVCALTLLVLSRNFSKRLLNQQKTIGHNREIQEFYAIKEISDMINKAVGPNFACFLVICMVDYSTSFDDLFLYSQDVHWSRFVTVPLYFISTCVILLLSADVCRNMDCLSDWLAVEENRRSVSVDHLIVLVSQLDKNVVALKAGRIFPITYSLVANVSTYNLISTFKKY